MGSYVFLTNKQIMEQSSEYWRGKAAEYRASAFESFERCDTDGFMSQAADQELARMYDAAALIADNGGYAEFNQVYDLDGNPVDAKMVKTRYGYAYAINRDGDTEWFNPSSADSEAVRVRNDAKKGYFVGKAEKPARILWCCTVDADPYVDLPARYTITSAAQLS